MKKLLIILGVVLCIALIAFCIFYFKVIAPASKILTDVRNMEIKNVDISQIADGKYIGEFSYSISNCKVEVTVKDHKIEQISIIENGTNDHAKKAEAVIQSVLKEQKINVDAVSGSTTTSKALLKAVENALTGAK